MNVFSESNQYTSFPRSNIGKYKNVNHYKKQMDVLLELLNEYFSTEIKIYKLNILLKVLRELNPYLTFLYMNIPEVQFQIIEICDYLKKIKIVHSTMSDFNSVGYLDNDDQYYNEYFGIFKNIEHYYPKSSAEQILGTLISEIEKINPRFDIKKITSLDFCCHNRSSKISYFKKVMKVCFATDIQLIGWANAYGFNLQSLSKPERSILIDILIGYVLLEVEIKVNKTYAIKAK